MRITLEVTIDGLEGWNMDWSDDEGVRMELFNMEDEVRHAIVDRLGVELENVEVDATLEARKKNVM